MGFDGISIDNIVKINTSYSATSGVGIARLQPLYITKDVSFPSSVRVLEIDFLHTLNNVFPDDSDAHKAITTCFNNAHTEDKSVIVGSFSKDEIRSELLGGYFNTVIDDFKSITSGSLSFTLGVHTVSIDSIDLSNTINHNSVATHINTLLENTTKFSAITSGLGFATSHLDFSSISDGSFSFDYNGITHDIIGLDFTSVTNMNDVANVFTSEFILSLLNFAMTYNVDTGFTLSSTTVDNSQEFTNIVEGIVGTDVAILLSFLPTTTPISTPSYINGVVLSYNDAWGFLLKSNSSSYGDLDYFVDSTLATYLGFTSTTNALLQLSNQVGETLTQALIECSAKTTIFDGIRLAFSDLTDAEEIEAQEYCASINTAYCRTSLNSFDKVKNQTNSLSYAMKNTTGDVLQTYDGFNNFFAIDALIGLIWFRDFEIANQNPPIQNQNPIGVNAVILTQPEYEALLSLDLITYAVWQKKPNAYTSNKLTSNVQTNTYIMGKDLHMGLKETLHNVIYPDPSSTDITIEISDAGMNTAFSAIDSLLTRRLNLGYITPNATWSGAPVAGVVKNQVLPRGFNIHIEPVTSTNILNQTTPVITVACIVQRYAHIIQINNHIQ